MTGAWKTRLTACAFSVFLAFLSIMALPANAQDTGKNLPSQLQPEAMEKLVSDLDPEQVKALTDLMTLLQQGAAAKGAQTPPPSEEVELIEKVQTAADQFGALIANSFRTVPELFSSLFSSIGALIAGTVAGPVHIFIGAIALILAAGFAAEFLVNRLFASRREKIQSHAPHSLFETVKLVSTRAALDLGGLIVFAIVAFAVGKIAIFDPVARAFAFQAVYWIVFLPRIVAALLRFALAPHRSELRLVTADDTTAKSLYRSFTSLFAFVGVTFFLRNIMIEAGDGDVAETFRFFIGFGVNLWIAMVIWNARHGLTSIILGDEHQPTSGLERMARFWPYFSIAFIAFN